MSHQYCRTYPKPLQKFSRVATLFCNWHPLVVGVHASDNVLAASWHAELQPPSSVVVPVLRSARMLRPVLASATACVSPSSIAFNFAIVYHIHDSLVSRSYPYQNIEITGARERGRERERDSERERKREIEGGRNVEMRETMKELYAPQLQQYSKTKEKKMKRKRERAR